MPKGPTDGQILDAGKAVIETAAKYTGMAALADALRKYGPAVGKAILDHGGKSAAQQDMDDLAGRYPGSKPEGGQQGQQGQSNTASPNPNDKGEKPKLESTPGTNKKRFESVRGTNARRNKETGEIWVKDRLHKDHYEVYKNKRDFERGRRSRSVWEDGRPKEKF
jgi:hypothetical protein